VEAARVRSFEKFSYLLRPSKQVERKLFVEALHHLSSWGFSISDYTYLGLGSVYYADFILFYKYLYLNDMICVEKEDIPKRMEFNKPFPFIRLRMKRVSEVLPELDRGRLYIVWLDYDSVMDEETLRDIEGFAQILRPGSVLIVTVEADPKFRGWFDSDDTLSEARRRELILDSVKEKFGRYCRLDVRTSALTFNQLPRLFADILRAHVSEKVGFRSGFKFCQLFNLRYRDGAQMLTVGGMVCDRKNRRKLMRSGIYKLSWITRAPEPITISVPPLTIREKHWLDQSLNVPVGDLKLRFELAKDLLQNYREYHKYYPIYYETLL